MSSPDSRQLPLFVDLDGTLTKTDVSLETVLQLLGNNVFYLALLPFWLARGLVYFKRQVAWRVQPMVSDLPYNEEFLDWLRQQKSSGRKLTLISASHQDYVSAVGEQVGLFDHAVGTQDVHLRADEKLKRIRELVPDGEFAYAGNSHSDLVIWSEASQAILVNCTESLRRQVNDGTRKVLHFDTRSNQLFTLLKAIRPHQWTKNLLVFSPLILAHRIDEIPLLILATLAFVSFSLCASSVYILNDMLDLTSDRCHPVKRSRPFAAGNLPLGVGFLLLPGLLLAAFTMALWLPWQFAALLASYWLLSTLYSVLLKQFFLLDVLLLAILYTLRLFAGAAAVSVPTSDWLITFSLTLFLGLAMVKRVTELSNLRGSDSDNAAGRNYHLDHRRPLMVIGALISFSAVIIFAFYSNAPETTRLYTEPAWLWLICPLLLLLLVRIWTHARSGKLHEDPVLFAISDRFSQFVVLLCGVLIWLAI